MSKYYTPKLEEFVQGFKYQVCISRKGDCIGQIGDLKIYNDKNTWVKTKVWWDREPEFKTIVYPDEFTFSYMETKWELSPSYDIETYLNNGMIRAKRNG